VINVAISDRTDFDVGSVIIRSRIPAIRSLCVLTSLGNERKTKCLLASLAYFSASQTPQGLPHVDFEVPRPTEFLALSIFANPVAVQFVAFDTR
jgi:hypothetical protein